MKAPRLRDGYARDDALNESMNLMYHALLALY